MQAPRWTPPNRLDLCLGMRVKTITDVAVATLGPLSLQWRKIEVPSFVYRQKMKLKTSSSCRSRCYSRLPSNCPQNIQSSSCESLTVIQLLRKILRTRWTTAPVIWLSTLSSTKMMWTCTLLKGEATWGPAEVWHIWHFQSENHPELRPCVPKSEWHEWNSSGRGHVFSVFYEKSAGSSLSARSFLSSARYSAQGGKLTSFVQVINYRFSTTQPMTELPALMNTLLSTSSHSTSTLSIFCSRSGQKPSFVALYNLKPY